MLEQDLFDKERQLLVDINSALKSTAINMDTFELHSMLARLMVQHEKVLKQTHRLIKLNDRYARKLHQDNADLKYFSAHDTLTGLLNKGAITKKIQKCLLQGDWYLMLLDVDHFKKVNDTRGHYVGDLVLSGVGEIIRETLHDKGYLGRLGGEEFIVMLKSDSMVDPVETANQLRLNIANSELGDGGDIRVAVTVSVGLTCTQLNESFEAVYTRVDELMYQAKSGGRNRVASDVILGKSL